MPQMILSNKELEGTRLMVSQYTMSKSTLCWTIWKLKVMPQAEQSQAPDVPRYCIQIIALCCMLL